MGSHFLLPFIWDQEAKLMMEKFIYEKKKFDSTQNINLTKKKYFLKESSDLRIP